MKKRSRAMIVAAALALLAPACRRAVVPGEELASHVPERYRFLYEGFIGTDDEPKATAPMPFDRIELEEDGGWFAVTPTITFERNGAAYLSGDPPHHGDIRVFDYGRLCEWIEKIGFTSLPRSYQWGGFDGGTWTVRVWPSGAVAPIEVEDYGGVGPVELWSLRAAIQGVGRGIDWK